MEIYNEKGYLQEDEIYGYSLESVDREKSNKRLYISIYYSNNKTFDDALFVLDFVSHGFFKDIKKHKEIENMIKGKNIIDALAYIINDKYGYMHHFPESLYELIRNLPSHLYMNDLAMHNLLSKLQADNQDLLIEVGHQIQENRQIYQEGLADEFKSVEKRNEDYKKIIDEFSL